MVVYVSDARGELALLDEREQYSTRNDFLHSERGSWKGGPAMKIHRTADTFPVAATERNEMRHPLRREDRIDKLLIAMSLL